MSVDLLSCPFCGSDDVQSGGIWGVHCKTCGALGPDLSSSDEQVTWNTRAPDPTVAVLEAEVARLREQIKCLTSPDLFWGEDGEDFSDGDDYHIWEGGIFQVSVGKLLGFRYAAYIPTEIDPETGAFDAGDVAYFPTEAAAISAQDAAVAALNPAPSEKEAG